MSSKVKVNSSVTISHIVIIVAFTITQNLSLFSKSLVQGLRMSTAFYFFGGVADIFLALMIWFILDDSQVIAVVQDGDRLYTVEDVI